MMNEAQKKMKRYTNAVERKLNMPREVRARVMTDFISSIQGRRESGQSDEAIFAELGSPKKVAAELNEQMKDYTYVKSPWRWACVGIILLCCLSLICGGVAGILSWMLTRSEANSLGIIGGADGPTAIFVTTSPDHFLYQAGISLLIMLMALLGFYRLSRCPRN